jgi:ubiquinone/menaquinone biosynthesis C-methylase UbiE
MNASATYKLAQRAGWDDAAPGWQEHYEVTERQWGFITQRLIELAGVKVGDRVLDLASGIGEPGLSAAHRVGPTGHVVVTDLSPAMLAIAMERASQMGLTNVEFDEMDAEAIDLPERSFDVVVCRFGLMFLADVLKGLKGIYKVLGPGGRLATATARAPQPNAMTEWVLGPLVKALGISPPPPLPGAPGIFALGDPARIERLLDDAGFTEIHAEVVAYVSDFDSGEELATWQFAISAPIRQMLAGQPSVMREAAWRAVADAANQHADHRGRVSMQGETVLINAKRPAGN